MGSFTSHTSKDPFIPYLGGLVALELEAEIIERHLHSNEIWFGAQPGQVGPGSQNSLTGFRTTSAAVANTFGAAIVVLDGSETPVRAGMRYFDPHRIQVLNVQNNAKTYRLRLASNRLGHTSWAAAVAAGVCSDVCFKIDVNTRDASPFPIQTVRQLAGAKVWAAVATADAVAQWVDVIFGIHEYAD